MDREREEEQGSGGGRSWERIQHQPGALGQPGPFSDKGRNQRDKGRNVTIRQERGQGERES